MILVLLLSLVAVSQCEVFSTCPPDSACLYFARCRKDASIVLSTTNPRDYDDFDLNKCGESSAFQTQLFVQPLSEDKWNFTLTYHEPDVGILFGDKLNMMSNRNETIFQENSEDAETIFPYIKQGKTLVFTVSVPGKKLLEIFKGSQIIYDVEQEPSAHNVPDFWNILTPCDPKLIVDDCTQTSAASCSALVRTEEDAKCPDGKTMWLHADEWLELQKVTCEKSNKEWKLTSGNNTLAMTSGKIRCDVAKPETIPDTEVPAIASGKETTSATIPNGDTVSSESSDPKTEEKGVPSSTEDDVEPSTKMSHGILPTFVLPIVLYFARM